VAIIGESS
jgi:DNA-binding transcriptional regulator YiaG